MLQSNEENTKGKTTFLSFDDSKWTGSKVLISFCLEREFCIPILKDQTFSSKEHNTLPLRLKSQLYTEALDSFCKLPLFPNADAIYWFDWVNSKNNVAILLFLA